MKTQSLLSVVSVLALLGFALSSFAQDAGDGLQEITVTAQRQAQNVLSVPVSVQAVSGDQLNNSGIRTLTDLQLTTPGYMSSSVSGFTQIYIRGVGNLLGLTDPGVATFVDDVPRIYGTMNENFLDVSRVEVLKGAQGGLYGRNAVGGVVNIITNQPSTDKIDGNALIDYGEYNTVRVAGYTNLPVNDKVAVSLAAERDSHDPYVTNIATADPYSAAMFPTGSPVGSPQQTANFLNAAVHVPDLDNENFWATDDKVLVKLSDDFKITIAGDYTDKHDSSGNQYVASDPALLQGYLTGLLTEFGFNPKLPPGLERTSTESFTSAVGDPVAVDTRDYGTSATAVWNASGVDVTSISAFRRQGTIYYAGAFSGNVPTVSTYVGNRRWFAYQELRAISTGDGPFHFLAGASYLANHLDGVTQSALLGDVSEITPTNVTDFVHNWSAYAQAGYDITPDLNLTASGRYIHETNHATFTEPTDATAGTVEDKFLPSATLSYKLEDGNIYARWARGFKPGGINTTTASAYFPTPNGSVYGPETVDTYEVGYRTALLNHRVQLTTAFFYNDFRNLQVSDYATAQYASTITLAIINAGAARSWGAEEELAWQVAKPITVGVNAGYLNAKYTRFELSGNPVLADFDRNGQTMINSPKLQASFSANLDQPLNDKIRLVGTLVESYMSTVVFAQSAAPGIVPDAVGPAYWLANLRLGVRTSDDKYGFSIYANNLFNRAYFIFGSPGSVGNDLNWGNPRIIGGEITAKF